MQAFDTHFDLHHVFAVQVEGEKTWRLYENRAEAPVSFPVDDAEARRWFAQTRGPLMTEVRMQPGDVLYLPRGWYHDALATEGASLHVTFSVSPLYGRVLFSLLESAAMQDPAFRQWLAPGTDGGVRLARQLADLGRRLAELSALPAFRDEVLMAQERLVPRGTVPGTTRLSWPQLSRPRSGQPHCAWSLASPGCLTHPNVGTGSLPAVPHSCFVLFV